MKIVASHHSIPAIGETANGDRAYFRVDGQRFLIAVVDGLGHGPGADAVSSTAEKHFASADLSLPLLDLMQSTHAKLGGSRGAAATLCLFHGSRVEACAVGNVELRSGVLQLPLVGSPGVLGARVAKFRVCEATVERPGRLILFSDGISSRTRFDEFRELSPERACQEVIEQHRRDYDDCTVLIADLDPTQ